MSRRLRGSEGSSLLQPVARSRGPPIVPCVRGGVWDETVRTIHEDRHSKYDVANHIAFPCCSLPSISVARS